MIACVVAPEHVEQHWPAVAPMIEKALEHGMGEYTLDDAKEMAASGAWRLFMAVKPGEVVAAGLGQIDDYPRKRVFWIRVLGAVDSAALEVMRELTEQVGRAAGCNVIAFAGRPGWVRSVWVPRNMQRVHEVAMWPLEG